MKDQITPESIANTRLGILEKTLVLIFILSFAMPVFWGFRLLYIAWINDEVVSTRSIGNFVSMSGPGGFQDRVVITTDMGSFPMRFAAAIVKGTPLILEVRASGQRYICKTPTTPTTPPTTPPKPNTPAIQCVETGGPDFGDLPQGVKP